MELVRLSAGAGGIGSIGAGGICQENLFRSRWDLSKHLQGWSNVLREHVRVSERGREEEGNPL